MPLTSVFQSTPPRGGRQYKRGLVPIDRKVSIHAPARGATSLHVVNSYHCSTGFNPRPRAGGDITRRERSKAERVSIHAPARGATRFGINRFDNSLFQSTPPRGGRRQVRLATTSVTSVSIHAPARGATAYSESS